MCSGCDQRERAPALLSHIDLIVMMRPLSPGLYMQMAGRAIKPGGDCLVLDFAGVVQTGRSRR